MNINCGGWRVESLMRKMGMNYLNNFAGIMTPRESAAGACGLGAEAAQFLSFSSPVLNWEVCRCALSTLTIKSGVGCSLL
jgi:hypothetical protein